MGKRNRINYNQQKVDDLIHQLFEGQINVRNLPIELHLAIADKLFSGVKTGFGGDVLDFEFGSSRRETIQLFKTNTFVFSAAKTFQQVKDMSSSLFKDGERIPFSDFKKSAQGIFDTYNKTWLTVEFRTATNQALSGKKWMDIQENKEALPLIMFQTVGDDRVRDEHIIRDGIVRPVDDPFWDENFPPIDWNCRCVDVSLESGERLVTSKSQLNKISRPPKLFRMNPGKDKIIFSPSHPYFKVESRFKILKDNNFNLPIL